MKRGFQPGTLRFIFIAVVFMLLMDQFVFGGKRSYIEDKKTVKIVEQQEEVLAKPEAEPPVRVAPEKGDFFEQVPEEKKLLLPEGEGRGEGVSSLPDKEEITPSPKSSPHGRGLKRIAIIIDDLGMDVKHTKQVMDLPAPITLAFLPYAPRVRALAAVGKSQGHELIIHTPMEAMDGNLNIGPGGLKANMSAGEFQAAFGKMLGSFDGYAGINNHMGSRLTQDKEAMGRLMNILATKDLFFVDSKTIQTSVAAHEAAAAGVKYAERDVFLDHVENRAFVDKALVQLERMAARKGYAIAIGHPKSFTIEGLRAWIPTLSAKGIELVPVSRLLVTPSLQAVIPNPKGEESSPVTDNEKIPPAAAPPFGMTEGQSEVYVPMEERPDVPAPEVVPAPAPAPSVDMFPEGGLNTTVPSAPESGETILWSPQPPTQSPAP